MKPVKKLVKPWILTGINLLVCPGMGTCIGGQKVVGVIQAVLALAGGLLSLCLIVVMFRFFVNMDSTPSDAGSFVEANGTLLGLGGGGFVLLAIAWVWSTVSSFQIASRLKSIDCL
ncbi:MAG: hypothetical protein VX392_04145 [Verrucomicrobiota bacterium]|nr:hypothetical protein [Verrucomicrobiota bacterium]